MDSEGRTNVHPCKLAQPTTCFTVGQWFFFAGVTASESLNCLELGNVLYFRPVANLCSVEGYRVHDHVKTNLGDAPRWGLEDVPLVDGGYCVARVAGASEGWHVVPNLKSAKAEAIAIASGRSNIRIERVLTDGWAVVKVENDGRLPWVVRELNLRRHLPMAVLQTWRSDRPRVGESLKAVEAVLANVKQLIPESVWKGLSAGLTSNATTDVEQTLQEWIAKDALMRKEGLSMSEGMSCPGCILDSTQPLLYKCELTDVMSSDNGTPFEQLTLIEVASSQCVSGGKSALLETSLYRAYAEITDDRRSAALRVVSIGTIGTEPVCAKFRFIGQFGSSCRREKGTVVIAQMIPSVKLRVRDLQHILCTGIANAKVDPPFLPLSVVDNAVRVSTMTQQSLEIKLTLRVVVKTQLVFLPIQLSGDVAVVANVSVYDDVHCSVTGKLQSGDESMKAIVDSTVMPFLQNEFRGNLVEVLKSILKNIRLKRLLFAVVSDDIEIQLPLAE